MTLTDAFTLATNSTFLGRVVAAIVTSAQANQAGGTVAAPPTDAAIQTASDAIWNAEAGVP